MAPRAEPRRCFGTLAGTAIVGASPAAATTRCYENNKEFPTSGSNVDVRINLCVSKWWGGSGGSTQYTRADAYISWEDGGGNKWDNFDVQVRLEDNDADIRIRWCDLTYEMDTTVSGSYHCQTDTVVNGAGDTADGYVSYNINDDGDGAFGWSLHGSPVV